MERHPLDVVSLVFGLLFTVVAVLGLTDVVQFTDADVRWFGPGLLVLIGLVLVLTAGLGRRRVEPSETPEPREQRDDHLTGDAHVAGDDHGGGDEDDQTS